MAQFSGAVKLADLNDFIAPSQACVVNISGSKDGALHLDNIPEVGAVQPQQRAPAGFQQTAPSGPNGAIKVTLQDCLACSGCVTSAETVLLEHQSTAEFLSKLAEPGTTVVVTLSPQTRAALAAFYGLPPGVAQRRLAGFFKGLGVRAVLDASAGRDFALLEAAAEFVERYRRAHPEHKEPAGPSPVDTTEDAARDAVDERLTSGQAASPSGRAAEQQANGSTARANGGSGLRQRGGRAGGRGPGSCQAAGESLPMLASACPGWVCYAEKTHGSYILPHISATKSPQAMMGTLVKRHLAPLWGLDPARLYHCAIMPCYDKKLEASREDFNLPGMLLFDPPCTSVPEVDSVLTSGEVQQLLAAHGASLATAPEEAPLDSLVPGLPDDGRLYGLPGGSGGYLNYVIRAAARQLFGRQLPPGPLPLRTLRNADFQEVSLEVDEGRPALRFALAYGFRNIQTLVRKIKRGVCEYDYVEIMACPGGCLNGGGQIAAAQGGQTSQQLLDQLDTIYHDPEVVERQPEHSPVVAAIYSSVLGQTIGSEAARALFHTQYHRREKTLATAAGDW